MSAAYDVFVTIITEQLSLYPDRSPSWDSILQEIQKHFPTFNRSIKTLQRWYRRQLQGKEMKELKRGRRIDGELKDKIKDYMLEQTRRTHSCRTAASTFQIPLSTARLYIKNHIGFQRKMRPTIPYHLTQDQKKVRVCYCRIMRKILEISREVGYKNIITGDESYFLYNYDADWSYVLPGTSPNPRVKTDLPHRKLLLTIFLWGGGMCLLYDLPQGVTMTSSRFINTVMNPIHQWWKGKAEMLAEDVEQIQCNTKSAIAAAKHEVELIAGVDLSRWDKKQRCTYNKLNFVKECESIMIQNLQLNPPTASADYITLHKPRSHDYPVPPPKPFPHVQPPAESSHTILKPIIIQPEYQHLPPIKSMYASLLSTSTYQSASISRYIPPASNTFPSFNHHREIIHKGFYSNIASLIRLLFGSRCFKRSLLQLTNVGNDCLLCDIVTIFHQLASPDVSPLDLHHYNSFESTLSNDCGINPLAHNLELTRVQFWSNNPIIDAYNITIPIKKNSITSTRYLEEALEGIQMPSQPPTSLFIYIDRSLPNRKKINTRFYFPVYDSLEIPSLLSQYQLRGMITHTASQTQTNQYTAIVKEGDPDRRWIAFSNGQNTVITDIAWPQNFAYGDDFDDLCSSACLLLYEKSECPSLPNPVHDTYTPYKHRSGLLRERAEDLSSENIMNPVSTPQHTRTGLHFDRTSSTQLSLSNSDSDSSSIFSSSTSSTLFSDSESGSVGAASSDDDSTVGGDRELTSPSIVDHSFPSPSHSPHSTPSSSSSSISSSIHNTTSPSIVDHSFPSPSHSPHSTPSSSSSSSSTFSALDTPPHFDGDIFIDSDGAIHIPALSSQTQLPLELFLHLDNARVHTSHESSTYLQGLPFIKCPHPPYSPDIAPCDFFLFGYLKRKLAMDGVHSSNISNVVKRYLVEIEPDLYGHVFDHWHDRLAWVANHGGEYYPSNRRRQEMNQYKHLYHLRSNSCSKAVNDKPYVCNFCNRRYSSKPSLQTHISIKHVDFKASRLPSISNLQTPTHSTSKLPDAETPSNTLIDSHFNPLPMQSRSFASCAPIVQHFSCIPLALPSSNLRPHQLKLRILYPHSNQSVVLSGTLFLDNYTQYTPTSQPSNSTQIPQVTEQSFPNAIEECFPCPLCSARFPTRRGLSIHIGMRHNQRNKSIQSEELPSCPHCKKVFSSALGLTVHISKMHPEVRDVFDDT